MTKGAEKIVEIGLKWQGQAIDSNKENEFENHETIAFDAFISCSWPADGKLTPALQRALERFGKPWYRRHATRCCRDQTNSSATPELWSAIESAVDQSGTFVLLASPQAAQRKWVEKEIAHWSASKSHASLLIVFTARRIVWDETSGDLDWTQTDTLSPLTALVPLIDAITNTADRVQVDSLAQVVAVLAPRLGAAASPTAPDGIKSAIARVPNGDAAGAIAAAYVALPPRESVQAFVTAVSTLFGFPLVAGPATDVLTEALREVGGPGKEAGFDATLARLRATCPDMDPDAVPAWPPPPPPPGWEGLQCSPV